MTLNDRCNGVVIVFTMSIIALDIEWGISYTIPTPLGGVGVNVSDSDTIRRLKTIEGHLRGIIKMVQEDVYCIDVIRQIQAVEGALNKVSAKILEGHLNSCVITAVQGDDPSERERVMKEITDVFEMSTKV